MIKHCVVCGEAFEARGNVTACSPAHIRMRKLQASRDWKIAHPESHKIWIKRCVICDRQFVARYIRSTVCSMECREVSCKRRQERWSATVTARRAVIKRICVVCGDEFLHPHGLQNTCSVVCRRVRTRAMNDIWDATHAEQKRIVSRVWRRRKAELLNERRRLDRIANPKKYRDQSRRWRHGLSPERKAQYLDSQRKRWANDPNQKERQNEQRRARRAQTGPEFDATYNRRITEKARDAQRIMKECGTPIVDKWIALQVAREFGYID